MSPTLFLIMFNDLLVELNKKGFLTYAYADDLAIVGRYKSQINKAIDITEDWTTKNKMIINKKKSGIIFFKKKTTEKWNQERSEDTQ